MYIKFTSLGSPATSEQCTTRWPEIVTCSIVASGFVGENFHNLCVMDGDSNAITQWVSENSSKVEILTKEQTDNLGQSLTPVGTERIEKDMITGIETTYIAGVFDSENPQNLWSVK